MMSQLPREWVDALDNQCDLAADPEKHAAKLVSMAFECRRRNQVDDLQLSDMLEMAEAARWFGLSEHEEAYAIGLFSCREPEPDHYVHEILRKGKVR
ncbi:MULTISPECIES: hypothetical protein [Pseudomonas]|uniref:hypothetical protein n=1 Tax=Pseudomonas TaxID=286 RepID=UPI001FFECC3F|nr:hypothetical protein [Pseudomonas sp. A2]UPK86790.1 hypothetical protein E5221_18150 [Pseudomonas sp. A2]